MTGSRTARALACLTCFALASPIGRAEPLPTGNAPASRFGITLVGGPAHRDERRLVLLVHGLDDSSAVWRDLLVALAERGLAAACFDYPDDGSIADAADLLAECLERLRAAGVRRIDVVAHSMGGLVVRDLLTRPAYYDGDGRGSRLLPAVDRVVMLGTPHHGAPLARVRQVVAVGERVIAAVTARAGWAGAVDGTGEAADELRSGSMFLRSLDARPFPRHTRVTIVAGLIASCTPQEVDQWIERRTSPACTPEWVRRCMRRTGSCIGGTINGLGDGVVPLGSTRWAPVNDYQVVRAGHVGMILRGSATDDVPPAIPIILERLGTTRSPQRHGAHRGSSEGGLASTEER